MFNKTKYKKGREIIGFETCFSLKEIFVHHDFLY